jgi:NAD(P) transhydrogenase subunit alpha
MIAGILREQSNEYRVAMTPNVIKKLPEFSFYIESDAGVLSGYSDAQFISVGAKIEKKRKQILESARVLLSVTSPNEECIQLLKPGSILIGQLNPIKNIDRIKQLARIGISAFSVEWLPRITRAQSMDVLSSQSNLAGYQAVIYAVVKLGRIFPVMMTAAGTIPAVRVLVVGAGVAGLQAIATAKRLGAIVSAFDVRFEAKEQVESLGATFIDVPNDELGDSDGGYAKEMSAEYKKAQELKLLDVICKQDVVITTAQIPNKPAPRIITKEMVSRMKDNSLVIDLAGETGGNCELSVCGEEVIFENKQICAPCGIINGIANTASFLLASNFAAFIKTLFKIDNDTVSFDLNDELVQRTLITHGGVICNASLKQHFSNKV